MGFMEGLERGFELVSPVFRGALESAETAFARSLLRILAGFASAILLPMLALLAAFLLSLVFSVAFTADTLTASSLTGIAAILLMLFSAFFSWILITSSLLGTIQNAFHKKKLPYFSKENLFSALKVALLFLLILVVCCIPFGALYYLKGNTLSGVLAILYILLLVLAAPFLFVFFYYTLQEMAIEKKGLFASMRGSISLVRKNFWETMLIGFLMAAMAFAIRSMFVMVMYVILVFLFVAAMLLAMLVPAVGGILILVCYFFLIVLALLLDVFLLCLYSIVHTSLYKQLKQPAQKAKNG